MPPLADGVAFQHDMPQTLLCTGNVLMSNITCAKASLLYRTDDCALVAHRREQASVDYNLPG